MINHGISLADDLRLAGRGQHQAKTSARSESGFDTVYSIRAQQSIRVSKSYGKRLAKALHLNIAGCL